MWAMLYERIVTEMNGCKMDVIETSCLFVKKNTKYIIAFLSIEVDKIKYFYEYLH